MELPLAATKLNRLDEDDEDDDEEEVGERRGLMADQIIGAGGEGIDVLIEGADVVNGLGPPNEARKFTQILAVLAVSFGCFIHGTTVAFPAVFLPSLMASNGTTVASNENVSSSYSVFPETLPFYIYSEEQSLIVSIASFGMLAGSLVGGPMANLIGRKWTCILGTCLSLSLSYALIPFATHIWMILLGRFMMGAGLGFSMTISTLYIMEIATPSMRAGLAVVPAIAGTLGILTCQCLGAVLDWRWLSVVLACFNIPFFIMLIFIPETPVYLIGKEHIERAHKVLRMLRGKKWDITKELTDLKCASEGIEKHRIAFRDFVATSVLKPFVISLCLMFFFQFSGINIILQYTVDIFQTAESTINEFMATIFVGLALLGSNIITLMIANKMKRRLMLLFCSMGISLTLIVMGVYFFLKSLEKAACEDGELVLVPVAERLFDNASLNSPEVSAVKDASDLSLLPPPPTKCPEPYTANLGWLPLCLLMIYIFFFNLGFGSMIWITVAEILPQHVRSVTNSLSVGFTCVCSFLTSHTYKDMMSTIKGEGVFWLYGGISLVGFFFIMIFVPETKDKSEAEIQEYFLPKSQRRANQEKRESEVAKTAGDPSVQASD